MKSPHCCETGTAVFGVQRRTTVNDLRLKQTQTNSNFFPPHQQIFFGVCTNIWGNQILISINPQMGFQPLKLKYCKPWSWNGCEMSSMFPKRHMFCFTRGSNLGGHHMTITSFFISNSAKSQKQTNKTLRQKQQTRVRGFTRRCSRHHAQGWNQQPAYCANSVSRWCGIIGCWASDWCGAAWQAERRTAPDLQDLVSGKECRSRALIGRAPCRSWGVVGSAVRGTAGGGWGRRETVGERWKQACWLF